MSKVLNEDGYDVFSSDLIDRGYGEAPIDFLDDNQIKKIGKYDVVMTNPPFCNGKEFVLQAKKVARKKICILNKTLFIFCLILPDSFWAKLCTVCTILIFKHNAINNE